MDLLKYQKATRIANAGSKFEKKQATSMANTFVKKAR